MKAESKKVSATRLKWLRDQGYTTQTDQEINDLAFGHRFAFKFCTILMAVGVVTSNIPYLSILILITFFSVVLKYHVFDYVYNYILSKALNKPKLPPRSMQLKFACFLATLWIAAIIYLFFHNLMMAGYIVGSLLVFVAFLVGFTDFCLPSLIYNNIFKGKDK